MLNEQDVASLLTHIKEDIEKVLGTALDLTDTLDTRQDPGDIKRVFILETLHTVLQEAMILADKTAAITNDMPTLRHD